MRLHFPLSLGYSEGRGVGWSRELLMNAKLLKEKIKKPSVLQKHLEILVVDETAQIFILIILFGSLCCFEHKENICTGNW